MELKIGTSLREIMSGLINDTMFSFGHGYDDNDVEHVGDDMHIIYL